MNFTRCKTWFVYFAGAIAIAKGILFGRVLLRLGGDEVHSIYSAMVYLHDWVSRGCVPLWNTLSACGAPFGASSISLGNIYYLTAGLLPPNVAYNAVIFFSVWFNGILMYEFLLKKSLSLFASFIGGLAWMAVTASAIDSGFFGLTLSFLTAEIYSLKRSRLSYVCFVLSLAFYSINAHPQFFLYGSFFLWAYLLSKNLKPAQGFLKNGVNLLVPFLIALGLSSFHWARLVEWIHVSNRSSWTELQALLPTHYPLVFFPRLYQLSGRPDLDFIVPRIFQYFFSHMPSLRSLDRVLEPPYIGLWPVLSIFICIRGSQEKSLDPARFFIFSAFIVIVYLLIHPFLYLILIQHIPVWSGMTNIGRLFDIYLFSLAVSAAYAVDLVMEQRTGLSLFIRQLIFKIGVILAIFFVLLAAVRIFVNRHEQWLSHEIEAGLHATKAPTIFIEDVARFQKRRSEEFLYFIRQCISIKNPRLLIPLALFVVLSTVLYAYLTGKISRKSFQYLFALFVVIDLCYGNTLLEMVSSDPGDIIKNSRIVQILHQDRGIFRVMILEDKTKSFNDFFLVPQSNMIYDIATPDGYEPLYIKRYADFYCWLTKRSGPLGFVMHTMNDYDEDLANFINVKYFLTSSKNDLLEERNGYERIYEDKTYRLYRNKKALLRAFLVHKAHFEPNEEGVKTYMKVNKQSLGSEVVLLGLPKAMPLIALNNGGPEEAQVLRYEPNKIEIEIVAQSSAYLVISDTFYPGWKAKLDGESQPILLSNYAFRSLQIPAGKHHLTMSYEPKSLKIGCLISLAAVFVLLIVSKSLT